MNFDIADNRLEPVKNKILAGDRLNFEDGVRLYRSDDLMGIGRLADYIRRKKHADKAFYIYNQHINYTNICINGCRFCAYARQAGQPGTFTLSLKDIKQQLASDISRPVREFHIVGGLNPSLPFDYYVGLIRLIKQLRPTAVIKAFTAVEIDYIAGVGRLSVEKAISILKDAGLEMVPGGGAEVMSDRVQRRLFPKKINGRRWLEVMELLHRAGLTSNATMLYGHIETIEERVEHMLRLRALQDKTGNFSAFIPLSFHPRNTSLSHLDGPTAVDDLKTIAVARLILDNIDHIKAYWVMTGEKLAQVALSFGADDLDGTIVEEKITHMAGATSAKGLSRNQLHRLITSAGFVPVERDSFYCPVQPERPRTTQGETDGLQ